MSLYLSYKDLKSYMYMNVNIPFYKKPVYNRGVDQHDDKVWQRGEGCEPKRDVTPF